MIRRALEEGPKEGVRFNIFLPQLLLFLVKVVLLVILGTTYLEETSTVIVAYTAVHKSDG